MSFQLNLKKPVGKEIKRKVRRELLKAENYLHGLDSTAEAVHETRKCFKRVRASLRLVRDELGQKVYRHENDCLRDAARPLTEVRDAEVLVETLQKLTAGAAPQVKTGSFAIVRDRLCEDKQAVTDRVLKEEQALSATAKVTVDVRSSVKDWTIEAQGWSAVKGGLKRVYQAGCRAQSAAQTEPTVENLHEWRKQSKYLWHELQLLKSIWSEKEKNLGDKLHDLERQLGEDHDLAVLRAKLTANPHAYGGLEILESLLPLIDHRREELQQQAFKGGRRLYRDSPRAFTRRFKEYWKA